MLVDIDKNVTKFREFITDRATSEGKEGVTPEVVSQWFDDNAFMVITLLKVYDRELEKALATRLENFQPKQLP